MDTLPVEREAGETRYARIPRTLLTDASRVLAIYLGTRILQLLLVAWLAPGNGPSIKDRLLVWDGTWFVRVAREGYPHGYTYDDSGTMVGNGLAFFPGYPLLIRAVHALGLDAGWAAIGISWIAAAVAAVLLYLLGRDLGGEPSGKRLGYALALLFCAQPMSVVLSMGYSEATFCALVFGTLLAAYRRHWLTAGVLGFAASLTRPMGLAVAVALTVAAGLALREHPAPAPDGGQRRSAGWRAVAGSVLALAGVPAYLVWVGLRVGHANAWFTIQTAGWGTTTDWGRSTVDFVRGTLRTGTGWVQVSVALLLIASVAAVLLALRRRIWAPLTVYGLLAFALVIGQAGYYHSKPRLLVPVLLTLLPAAYLAARARTRTAILALCGYAAFGLWYGAYMITVWPYTI
jgi:Mannosyltransferase (PIG-V)